MAPEIQFLSSPSGSVMVVAVSFLIFGLTAVWATRAGHADRRPAFLSAFVCGFVVAGMDIVAILAGWWPGSWTSVPVVTIVALCVLAGTGGFALWLGVYRVLERRARHPLRVYGLIVLLFIPVVLIADPLQIQRGWFEFGGGYTIWMDVLLGQAVMWLPVMLYVWLRKRMLQVPERDRTVAS